MPVPFPAPAPTPRELPDLELARRVASGEPELFELLMRRHNQKLFRVVRGVVDDDSEAEDVLQDAWVRAFEHLGGFRGEAAFATWVMRIALHEAWARIRKGRRFVALEPGREESIAAPGGGDPEQAAATDELRTALERAVATLRPHERTVFLLREVEGLTTAETAEALEISEVAVKVRLHRARARLRDDLDQRLGSATRGLFAFDGARCDRLVAAVLVRAARSR